MRRWKILKNENPPSRVVDIEFGCAHCYRDSLLPVNALDLVIAQVGSALVTDKYPSEDLMPDEIECPHCRRKYKREGAGVRKNV